MPLTRQHPDRDHWLREIERLDPDTDYVRISEISSVHEFPWDTNQSLSFALFRTYAVPSIGRLLFDTRQFTQQVQKRYDDTVVILDGIAEHGLHSERGRQALRRMNQMHAMYDIGNDDLRYVLCTFVAVPIRWLDDYGWRPLSEHEKVASAHYYRELGHLMGIRDIPETWQDFTTAMDAYEAAHFGYDPGARAVADSTLELMSTFPPFDRLPRDSVIRFSRAYMDAPLLDAFRYPHPTRAERVAARAMLRARGAWLRRQPPRETPMRARDLPSQRSHGADVDYRTVGTHQPTGTMSRCPIPSPTSLPE